MPSLYALGFRQGMLLGVALCVPSARWDGSAIIWDDVCAEEWLIVTQDCDLTRMSAASAEQVELRPCEPATGDEPSGIRSRFLILPGGRKLDGLSLRPLVPAAYIASLAVGEPLSESRLSALKLWLGRRYDRPAVPTALVDLMQALAKALAKNVTRRSGLREVRDVFVAVDDSLEPPRYALTAVCEGKAEPTVESVLVASAMEVSERLGTLTDATAVSVDEAALSLLERTYVADLSDVSINMGESTGAVPI